MRLHLATASLALILSAGHVSAQTTSPGAANPTFITQQPSGEWLATHFLGAVVTNTAGETIGDKNDIVFDKTGRMTTAVLGVGGFLGVGEKSVAIPFSALVLKVGKGDEHVIEVALSKEMLLGALAFQPTEKTMFMRAKERAGEIMGQAKKKIDEMTMKPKSQ